VDDWALINLPDNIKICVYFNLLYYSDIRYPISKKGNQSVINLDIQRRFNENAKKRGVNSWSSSCQHKKINFLFGFVLWTIHTNNVHLYNEEGIV
jgi:hypothetical protein